MDLKVFCSRMELGEEAQVLLKPHWEKIVENWGGKLSEFVSLEYVKKYLPLLRIQPLSRDT